PRINFRNLFLVSMPTPVKASVCDGVRHGAKFRTRRFFGARPPHAGPLSRKLSLQRTQQVSGTRVRVLTPADAEPYHALRLRMLSAHPDAFTSSPEEESAKPIAWVRERLTQREFPPAKCVLGAFSEDGRLLGSVGLA